MREVDDNQLIQAVRKRLLREIEAKQQQQAAIHNVINNQGGGGDGGYSRGGGLTEAMNGGGPEDPFEYLVDIEKRDIPGEEGGKPIGWTKKVHRHREKRGLGGK